MIKTDIAIDIKSHLDEKYKIWVDNNAGEFVDIDKDMTIEKQMSNILSRDKVTGIFRTQPGEIVALKDLFSSSFAFSLEFYVPVDINIYDDLDTLISSLNGSLQDNTEYRYIITFNSPFPVQNADPSNGQLYSIIAVTGSISHSNQSMYGNDFRFYVDDIELKGVLNHSTSFRVESEPKTIEDKNIPGIVEKYEVGTLSLTVHARRDDTVAQMLLNRIYLSDSLIATTPPSDTFYANPYPFFNIEVYRLGVKTTDWNMKLIEANEESSVGGYSIISCTFMRVVEL